MFRTFIFGLILGFFGAGAILYFVPLVDQHRVPSHITVQANGGNSEVLSIRLPADRIMSGAPGISSSMPNGLEWPQTPAFAGFKTEVFKIRDSENSVVGIGSRMARAATSGEGFVQWVVHMPARGTIFVSMEANPAPGQPRSGVLRAGTMEFKALQGSVQEAFVRDEENAEEGFEGRIDLRLALAGSQDETE